MHNVLICPDIHFSTTSSIVRSRGKKYSTKLENCMQSWNWLEELAIKEDCTSIFYLGDMFDKATLSSEEITALHEIKFADLPHYALVGNHEISLVNNLYNSAYVLQNIPNVEVITQPLDLENDTTVIHLLPYQYEIDEDITKIVNLSNKNKKHILFSHNDIKGINYGAVVSTNGLDLDILKKNCDLVINGHIHNGSWVAKNILNLGLLTGTNFCEDAFTYRHYVAILDLDTLEIKRIENPYALNFVKLDILEPSDLNKLKDLPPNCVASFRCMEDFYDKVKEAAETCIESKISMIKKITEQEIDTTVIDLSIDPLDKLTEFAIAKLGQDPILLEELAELRK